MRVQDYKNAEAIVSKLHDVVTYSNMVNRIISSSTMQDKYKLIAEQRTGISADKINCIYTLGKIDGVYHILVVYSDVKTRDVSTYRTSGIIGTSSINRSSDYFNAFISFAGDDIHTDLSAAYRVLCGIFACSPLDDVYYLYCFFNAFRRIYIKDDIKAAATDMTDEGIDIVEALLDNCYGIGYIPNEEDIANAKKMAKSKNKDNETE